MTPSRLIDPRFADCLTEILSSRELSVYKLSRLSGIPEVTIRRIKGKKNNASPLVKQKLCETLAIDPLTFEPIQPYKSASLSVYSAFSFSSSHAKDNGNWTVIPLTSITVEDISRNILTAYFQDLNNGGSRFEVYNDTLYFAEEARQIRDEDAKRNYRHSLIENSPLVKSDIFSLPLSQGDDNGELSFSWKVRNYDKTPYISWELDTTKLPKQLSVNQFDVNFSFLPILYLHINSDPVVIATFGDNAIINALETIQRDWDTAKVGDSVIIRGEQVPKGAKNLLPIPLILLKRIKEIKNDPQYKGSIHQEAKIKK